MTDLFDNKYQPGRILIQTVGSAGPGNSWVSALAVTQIEGNVEVWYSPDLTEVYDDEYEDEDNEPYLLGSIEGELDLRKLVSWLSFNKPEGFYFDEIKIKGVRGLWKDLIEISLNEEYSETLDHLLTLSDKELKLFWKKNDFFKHESYHINDVLDRINSLIEEEIYEADLSDLTFAEVLKHSKVKDPFNLGSLEEALEEIIEEALEEEIEV